MQGAVSRRLSELALPMMGGILGVYGFGLADTYFVALLGERELAAMSFTFPVIMVLIGVAFSMNTGTTSVVARYIGQQQSAAVRRIATDSLALAFLTVLLFATVGILTIDPLFKLLGAPPEILPLIRTYMIIWYPGMVFLVVPMVANASIRATGDTRFPALMMIGAMGFNLVLDPLLIFGLWGFPRMELEGAAWATVISRAVVFVASLLLMHYKEKLLDVSLPSLKRVLGSWKEVGVVALPATATNLLEPLAAGVVTRLIAEQGATAVAAWGAGSRIASFALVPIFGVCSGLVPLVAQNWGAAAYDRVYQAQRYGYGFALVWGLVVAGVLYLGAAPLARLFSQDQGVIGQVVLYLCILPVSFGMMGVLSVNEESLNAIGKPAVATVQTVVHQFGVYLPLGLLGAYWNGLSGLFAGLACSNLIGALFGLWLVRRTCRQSELDR